MAIKTENQIERDFYFMVRDSDLGKALRGGIYRSGLRPYGSKEEDLIVKFLSGLDEQVQTGVVVLNIYVPDIADRQGRRLVDHQRIGELQGLLLSFINENKSTEYWMRSDGTPTTMENKEIEQHFIYARIKFNRITI